MRQQFDKTLITILLALGAISISTIISSNKNLALNQAFFWIIGFVCLIFAANLYSYNWRKLSFPIYLFSLTTLIVVLFFGESVRGSIRWIDVGVFRFQPAEVAKLASILTLATFFHKRSAEKFENVILSFLLVLPLFIFIFVEPDIGSAMAIIAIWAFINFTAGMRKEHIIALVLFSALAIILSYEILAPYQKDRISTFLDPSRDPLGAGYNIIQSKIAIGSGQIFGRGLGRGTQSQLNFLPENESDFVFASLSEQLGLLGAGFLILLFAIFIIKILKLAKETGRFGQLIIMGSLGMFIYQFTVNVGMNMGIIPVTGITLPFVSYGGSSLIISLVITGIIISLKKQQVE